jgi:hypothetical protein
LSYLDAEGFLIVQAETAGIEFLEIALVSSLLCLLFFPLLDVDRDPIGPIDDEED